MFAKIPVPAKGEPARASWGASLANRVNELCSMAPSGGLARDGLTGTGFAPLPANLRERRAASELHPWKVFAVGKSQEVDHLFEIYVPEGAIMSGGQPVEVLGIEETDVEKRYTFPCEADIEVGGTSTLYLVVYKDDEDESEDDEPTLKSVLAVNLEEYEGDESVTDVIPIAELSVKSGERYDTGSVVSQMQKQAILLDDGEVPVDEISIDKVTAEDAKDPDAIQVKDFDNDKSDGGQGLAERLELQKEGSGESANYRIKAKENDSKVHIVARVNGKIKYIPLSGKDAKDPDEENPPEGDPCAHPGDKDNTGGVSPDDAEPGWTSGDAGDGGVSPSGEPHPGDDNCNCD